MMHMCAIDVSLQCLQFVWYVSGGRRRFCVAVTRVAAYKRLNSNRSTRSRQLIGQIDRNVFPDSAVFFLRTPQWFATTPQCGSVTCRRTAIKLLGDALGSTWINAIDEQPLHCLEIETRATHCAQSRSVYRARRPASIDAHR